MLPKARILIGDKNGAYLVEYWFKEHNEFPSDSLTVDEGVLLVVIFETGCVLLEVEAL